MLDISDARACASAIRQRRISSLELTEACLARIGARENLINAWAFLDPDLARRRARFADEWQAQGLPLGPLHGVPVGVKDVFDTADMPSEYGSPLYRGRRPQDDAAAVSRLRAAGAIVIGKTVTSEFGMYHPSKTRNPVDPNRSAGVSSSGSAAAVADGMVPLALGTQHTASTLLPASFCGVVGFKPSFGFTDMSGSNVLVPRLAQIGFLANSVADVALLASGFDGRIDEPRRTAGARLAAVQGPGWDLVEGDAAEAFGRWLDGHRISVLKRRNAPMLDSSIDIVRGLLDAHLVDRFGRESRFELLCPPLREAIVRGHDMTTSQFMQLNRAADDVALVVDELFENADVLITLAAPGQATLHGAPGSGALTMPWSLCGLPTLSLPLLSGRDGLPIGLQLVAQRGSDRLLLSCAATLR